MADLRGIDEQVEAAWRGFRARLADRLEQLGDDDWLRIEVDAASEGSEPAFVQFAAFGDSVRAEAGGPETLVLDLVWHAPDDAEPYLHVDRPRREVDRLAAESVTVLRDLMGVVHPLFIDADGLEVDPEARVPDAAPTPGAVVHPEEEALVVPSSRDHLRDAVDTALRVLLDTDEIAYDDDEDAPVRSGSSLAFVRVRHDRPAVEVFAEIVLGADDAERLAMELELLNQSHPYAKFFMRNDAVVMSHVQCATPFSPDAFRAVVRAFLDEFDEVARILATRVGGRRFLDPAPEPSPEPTLADQHPCLFAMLELMRDHTMTSARLATVFEHDQYAVVAALQAVRDESVDLDDEDPDLVVALLRKALRAVVDGEVARHRRRKPLPPKPLSRQESLLSDGDVGIETLDLGRAG
jgi:hypothetical protein